MELTEQVNLSTTAINQTPTAGALGNIGSEGEMMRAMDLGLLETTGFEVEEVYGCTISCSSCSAGSSPCGSCSGCTTRSGSGWRSEMAPSQDELLMALAE
jgi:7-cyano-7-deazaguanine synthase in queuosine biosynthesis